MGFIWNSDPIRKDSLMVLKNQPLYIELDSSPAKWLYKRSIIDHIQDS